MSKGLDKQIEEILDSFSNYHRPLLNENGKPEIDIDSECYGWNVAKEAIQSLISQAVQGTLQADLKSLMAEIEARYKVYDKWVQEEVSDHIWKEHQDMINASAELTQDVIAILESRIK
jgi:hypothetical protein